MTKINWELIRSEWESSEITFKDLAEKHNAKDSTIRSRKNREKWQRNTTDKNATQRATKKKSVATKKDSKKAVVNRKVQKNRSGNPNPENQFTKRNSAALLHGLRSEYLHGEQAEIMEAMEALSLADQMWFQIELKFSAIIRMQEIMWVDHSEDHLNEESGSSQGLDGDSVSYKVIYAHERFESYVRAQSRAMAEYRNLVKSYIELTDEFDERRMKLEGMQLNIDKSKVELEYLQDDSDDDSHERMQQYLKAIGSDAVEGIFTDEGDADAED